MATANSRKTRKKVGNPAFKFGKYGTETASTVVIGHTESVGTQVYIAYYFCIPFVTPFLVTTYRLSCPAKVRSGHFSRESASLDVEGPSIHRGPEVPNLEILDTIIAFQIGGVDLFVSGFSSQIGFNPNWYFNPNITPKLVRNA